MTISTEPAPLRYTGDGITLTFPITWQYFAKSHVVVTLRSVAGLETAWADGTNYTLTTAGVPSGGTLTAIIAPAIGETLVIELSPPNTQTASLPIGGPFPSVTVEDALDISAQRDSKLEAKANRSLRVPKTDSQSGNSLIIPLDTARANKVLGFDGLGVPTALAQVPGTVTEISGNTVIATGSTTARTLGNRAADVVNVKDFGAKGDAVFVSTTNPAGGSDTGTNDRAAFAAALAAIAPGGSHEGKVLYVPAGKATPDNTYYLIRGNGFTVTERTGIIFDPGVEILWDGTATHYLFTLDSGLNTRHHLNYFENIAIQLRNDSCHGIDMRNCISCHFAGITYIQAGLFTSPIQSRANIGLRIRSDPASDTFWNQFEHLWINHVHTGAKIEGNSQQFFKTITAYGDSDSGDTQSIAMDITGSPNSIVENFYFENYDNTPGFGAVRLKGPNANGWSFNAGVFDDSAGTGMTAVAIIDDGGFPKENWFSDKIIYSPATVVSVEQNAPASAGNYIGGTTNHIGDRFTVTANPQTSGTITLRTSSGTQTGNELFFHKKGKIARVFGNLRVQSVSSPLGRLLFTGLPYNVKNNVISQNAAAVMVSGLEATAAGYFVVAPTIGTNQFELWRINNGVLQIDTAAQFKADSEVLLDFTYFIV